MDTASRSPAFFRNGLRGSGLDSTGSGYYSMADVSEHGDESSGFIKMADLLTSRH
jgi:hypothetical protein